MCDEKNVKEQEEDVNKDVMGIIYKLFWHFLNIKLCRCRFWYRKKAREREISNFA